MSIQGGGGLPKRLAVSLGLAVFLVSFSAVRKKSAVGRAVPGPTMLSPYVTDGTMGIHDWTLAKKYSDEFNGVTVDTEKWDIQPHSWGNNWNWRSKNVSVGNGELYITMRYRPNLRGNNVEHYTSGIIESVKPIRYGFFEARIKGSYPQPGTCPAFWLGGEAVLQHASAWTEIDILEAGENMRQNQRVGRPYYVDHMVRVFRHPDAPTLSAHGRRQWLYNVGGHRVSWNPSAGYHIYGLEWTPRVIKMYIDGKLRGSIPNRWWHQSLVVILSLGLRPPYVDNPSPDGFPGVMKVDYVRVWTSASVDALSPLEPTRSVQTERQWMTSVGSGQVAKGR